MRKVQKEKEAVQKAKEAVQNSEDESPNATFCGNFLQDPSGDPSETSLVAEPSRLTSSVTITTSELKEVPKQVAQGRVPERHFTRTEFAHFFRSILFISAQRRGHKEVISRKSN